MRVRKIDTLDRRDSRQFIQLPFGLYRGCPLWVPPLASEMATVLDRGKHPFYRHSEADFFVAESEGQTLGRIAVLHNRNYSQHHGAPTAFFYYFDVVDDPQVSGALFDAACEWARQRQLTSIYGPRGFLRSSGIGLLVEGFEYLPAVGIAYNYPYYDRLVAAAGFVKETDYLSGRLDKNQTMGEKVYQIAERVRQRSNFWVKTFKNKREMRAWVPRINQVHDEAFHNNPGYYPSTPEEFAMVAENMIQIANPRLVKLIMKGDEMAGFVIAYADINRALQKTGGRLWPFGWARILWEINHSKVVDLNGLGMLPQHQGLGGNALLYVELEKTLRAFNFEQGELVQVDERNFKSKSDMEAIQVQWHKRHRTYRKNL